VMGFENTVVIMLFLIWWAIVRVHRTLEGRDD